MSTPGGRVRILVMFKKRLCVVLVIIAGCSLDELRPRKHPPELFVFNNGAEPQTLDPALMTGVPEITLAEALFEGLTSYHPRTLEPQPGVAQSWEVSKDGLTYIFHLREAKWSDSSPCTAYDFVYAWERVLNPETAAPYAYQLFYIKNARQYNSGKLKDFSLVGVKAVDGRTLRVELQSPTPFFLDLTSFATLYPVQRRCVELYGDRWTRPRNIVSNGAYVLKEWRQNRYILLERNPYYWDEAKTPAVMVLAIQNSDTALKMYITGEIDYIRSVPTLKVPLLQGRPDYHSSPYLGTYFLRINVTRKALSKKRVRKALALSIDRTRICRNILRGGQTPADSFTPPGIPGYDPPSTTLYNPELARKLLVEAGYPGGKGFPPIKLLFNTSETHRQIAVEVQQMWKRHLGIDIELLNQEWKVYLKTVDLLNYDVARSGWIGDYTDPNTFLDLFVTGCGNNRTGWSNAQYDRHIHLASITRGKERMEHFRKAEEILLDELPIIPIYFYVNVYLVRPEVKGLYDNIRDVHPLKYIYLQTVSKGGWD